MSGFFAFWLAGVTSALWHVGSDTEMSEQLVSMGLLSAGVLGLSLLLSTIYAVILRSTYCYYIMT